MMKNLNNKIKTAEPKGKFRLPAQTSIVQQRKERRSEYAKKATKTLDLSRVTMRMTEQA